MSRAYEHVKQKSTVGRLLTVDITDPNWTQGYDAETAWMDELPRHTERIRCPECGHEQDAEVLHSKPFAMFVHNCVNCEYIILESEWDRVEDLADKAEVTA